MKVMKLLIVLAFALFTNSAVRAESAYYKGDGGKGKVVLLDDVVMVNAMKGELERMKEDKAEGEYMLNRSGSIILYNHRNKGKWYSFKTEKNADGVYSITLISPKVPYGYNWQQQP